MSEHFLVWHCKDWRSNSLVLKNHTPIYCFSFFLGFLYGNFGQIRSVRLCSPAAIDGMQMRGITDVPGAYPIHKKVIIELVKIFFFFFLLEISF